MLRLVSSSCIAHAVRQTNLGSVSPHIFPSRPSKTVKWVLPKQNSVPDMTRLDRTLSRPGKSGETIKLVHRSSVVSLTDFTMSLSLVTGKTKSRVVTHTYMSQVSHILMR
jgi:hypothetical protein